MQNDISKKLLETLQTQFGMQEFRPGQLEALVTLMTGGRLLCIQPTGHGKSLLYQLPAVLLDGITVVISPLLALMRDQLNQLKNRFGIDAASFNTDQNDYENTAAKRALKSGNIRILFIAPEQLDNLERFNFLLSLPISLLVVDEAHCISTWGHDFRPSYRQIIKFAHALIAKRQTTKLLGLTATANEKTETDIKQQLQVDNKTIVIHRESMDRPNIQLQVFHTSGIATKLAALIQVLKNTSGTGLIYCATREHTEITAEYLNTHAINATAYHAGLSTERKRLIQQDFINDKYQVITATNALGMGIDKSNLRFIIHFDFPGSITAYYQEVGRCGRDGLPATGILLYDASDNKIQNHFIESAQPRPIDFEILLDLITNAQEPINLTTLKRMTGMHPTRTTVVLAELIEQDFIVKNNHHGKQIYQRTNKLGHPDLSRYLTQYKVRHAELKSIQNYAEQKNKCLMILLRQALGDTKTKACGKCNICLNKSYAIFIDQSAINASFEWLKRRSTTISLNKKVQAIIPGIAILDGKLRSKEFVSFMRERASSNNSQLGMLPELIQLIKNRLQEINNQHKLACIVTIPSHTWGARVGIAELFANFLNIPVFLDLLYWQTTPAARQGELLNNDQRQYNVSQRMRAKTNVIIPAGTILLVDDYIGSGATMNEAARALRQHAYLDNNILPFTIAEVKWRLGQRGMV